MTAAKLGKNKHKRKKKRQYIPIEVKNAVYSCHKTTVAVKRHPRRLIMPCGKRKSFMRLKLKFHTDEIRVSYG